MNPGNFKLQQMIVDTLSYIDYWDGINSCLGWGLALSIICCIVLFMFTFTMWADDNMKATTKDKATAVSFLSTFGLIMFAFFAGLIFTPSGSAQNSKLTMLTSQMVLDQQSCQFINSLMASNTDYARNVTKPIQCKRKSEIDDE